MMFLIISVSQHIRVVLNQRVGLLRLRELAYIREIVVIYTSLDRLKMLKTNCIETRDIIEYVIKYNAY